VLSLANVRILADASYSRWEVEVTAFGVMSRTHKLAPLFRLVFRRVLRRLAAAAAAAC